MFVLRSSNEASGEGCKQRANLISVVFKVIVPGCFQMGATPLSAPFIFFKHFSIFTAWSSVQYSLLLLKCSQSQNKVQSELCRGEKLKVCVRGRRWNCLGKWVIKPHIKCDAKNTQLQQQLRACSHFGNGASGLQIHCRVRKGSDGGGKKKRKTKSPWQSAKTDWKERSRFMVRLVLCLCLY